MEDIFHLGIKGLIRNKDGYILLLQVNPEQLRGNRHGVYWDLPGGRVKRGQTVEETLRAEIHEEMGARDVRGIKPIAMVLSNLRIPLKDGEDVGLILGVYQCAIGSNDIALSEEHVAFDWFSPAKAAELLRVKYPESFCEQIAALGSE